MAQASRDLRLSSLQQRDEPEYDRRGGSHHASHRPDHAPGERIHAVTIRTPRQEHRTIYHHLILRRSPSIARHLFQRTGSASRAGRVTSAIT